MNDKIPNNLDETLAKAYDNEWSNGVMWHMSKNPNLSIQDAIAMLRAEYAADNLPTPYDEGWKGTKRATTT